VFSHVIGFCKSTNTIHTKTSKHCKLNVLKPHRIHRCSILLQMSHVAWSVCVLVTRMYPVKTTEPTDEPFGRLTHVGGSEEWGGRDHPRKWQFGELSGPLKKARQLSAAVYTAKVIIPLPIMACSNNGTTCNAAFRQNSPTICLSNYIKSVRVTEFLCLGIGLYS